MVRTGAVGALLHIYEKAIADFKKVIIDIPDDVLTTILDPLTMHAIANLFNLFYLML